MTKKNKAFSSSIFAIFPLLLLPGWGSQASAQQIPQIPQVRAFLPMSYEVAMTEQSPIDGEWIIDGLRKRIRIEGGRAYAVDSWAHLFVLKIEPGMVIIKDIRRTGQGLYAGTDLPLVGQWNAQLAPSGQLNVTVAGILGKVNYKIQPLTMDDRASFESERNGTGQTAHVGKQPPQQYQPAPPQQYQPAPPQQYQPAPPQQYQPAPPASQPLPPAQPTTPVGCKPIGYDPDTGTPICA